MSYDSAPDAERIQRFAKRMKDRWQGQSDLDDISRLLILAKNQQDVATSGANAKPFRSGIGKMVVDEDAALLSATPFLHVNPPTDKEEDKKHASEKLEPWLSGAWRLSQQAGKVWPRKPGDLRSVGRAWSNIYPHPRLWGDSQYQKLVERLRAAEDEEEVKAAEKAIEEFKRDRFPIRWRYVSYRNTWTGFNGDLWLPEVIEIREMTRGDVIDEFGQKAVPGDAKEGDDSKLEVLEWANHEWCATIINSKDDPKIARKFHHSLGCSPYILVEAGLMPDNDYGWRWCGALFGAENLIESFDEILADLRQNHRDNTRTPLLIKYDPDKYDPGMMAAGRPKHIRLDPGSQHSMWTTEEVELAPVPQINPQSIQLLQEHKWLIMQRLIRPLERGESKSGDSANKFVTQIQIAEREFDPFVQALAEGANYAGKLFFRSVISLNEAYPDAPDKVFIFGEKGAIGVGPKDVRGQENAIQARISRAIPIDRNLQIQAATGLANLKVPAEIWLEQELGYENPYQVRRKARQEALQDAAFQPLVQEVVKRAGQLLQETPDIEGIAARMDAASPGLQDLVASGVAPTIPGGFLQGAANIRRTGTPQVPQLPPEGGVPPQGMMI